jgi:hypothetical protein
MRFFALMFAIVLAACSAEEEAPPERAKEGRAETQSIRNTESIGYSGDAVADKVDDALNKTEQRQQQTDQDVEQQSE